MKTKSELEHEDDLRPEYDFRRLKIVARGPGRKQPREATVVLEPDVAAVFPDSETVNEALRLLMQLARRQVPVT